MSNKTSWTKEDRSAWKDSEVFSQLEKNMIEGLYKLSSGNYLVKSSVISNQKVNETTQALNTLSTKITEVESKLKNLSDDGLLQKNDSKDQNDKLMFHQDNPHLDIFEAGDKEEDDIKDQIIDDLRCMAEDAIKSGNIKLAYQVERTIQEILDES